MILIVSLIIIDPLDYFGLSSIIPKEKKNLVKQNYAGRDTFKNGTLKMADFHQKKYENLILGDSRAMPIDTAYLYQLTGGNWLNFAAQGMSIRSCCSAFWWIIEHKMEPRTIYFSLNFWSSNADDYFGYMDDLCQSPTKYLFSKIVLRLAYYDVCGKLPPNELNIQTWEDVISWKKENINKMEYLNDNVIESIEKVIDYCNHHNIRIIFVLPSEHQDVMDVILSSEYGRKVYNDFLEYFSQYEFYNFNIQPWTISRDNFVDPMHPISSLYYSLCDSIFSK